MQKPVLVTRGIIVYPGATNTLSVGRSKSIKAVLDAYAKHDKYIILASQINPQMENPKTDDIYNIGTLCTITSMNRKHEDDINITVRGISPVVINKLTTKDEDDAYIATYTNRVDEKATKEQIADVYHLVVGMLNDAENTKEIFADTKLSFDKIKQTQPSLTNAIYTIADWFDDILLIDRQQILNTASLKERAKILSKYLINPSRSRKIDEDINRKINDELNKQQKEFYLRHKLGTIKDQLGELSSAESDIKSLKKRVEENPYPEYIKKRCLEELGRMEGTMNLQENAISRNYIEWLLCLPYWQESKDNENISEVEGSLNKTHYGLEQVKERIIEYLAVRTKNKDSKSPIICLVGPPGVGKSTLAKSIADALEKKFVQCSLGGVHDEAEIRGHRKTYLGSMPGRIIKGMKNAGVNNPLFLLDEIDKMGDDSYHGDPASALLEVLDPEQNNRFMDNYIEEPYDLSKVLFVATANYADQIPEPLYDRLEIIDLTSYTDREKLEIAKRHQIPKVLKQCGLKPDEIKFKDDAISYIINRYTKEAGVRQLERLINKIARKYIVRNLHGELTKQTIDIDAVKKYLDKEIYEYNVSDKNPLPGVVNGMAYTSAGGDLLPIEVTTFPGKGEITITGNLKETMKESASVALGYVKANAKLFGLEHFDFKKNDIHVHVPQGGVPKDGPSAGVTLTTAIISALSKRVVSSNIAMTGEITLRGKVLIIGGIKEKVISAFRGGVNEIFMPADDERYLKDVPDEVKKHIKFHFVKTYPEIYREIFVKKSKN